MWLTDLIQNNGEKKNKEDILKCHFCEEKCMRKLNLVNKEKTEDKTFVIMNDKYN